MTVGTDGWKVSGAPIERPELEQNPVTSPGPYDHSSTTPKNPQFKHETTALPISSSLSTTEQTSPQEGQVIADPPAFA